MSSESDGLPLLHPSKASHQTSKRNRHSLDITFLRRFVVILRITLGTVADFFWLLTLAALSGAQIFVVSLTGSIIGGFYDAITKRETDNFKDLLWKACTVQLAAAALLTAIKVLSVGLAWRWRRSLVRRLHEMYFMDRTYYKLNNFYLEVDNPDQRITQDVDNLAKTMSELAANFLLLPFQIAFYSYKTWTTIAWYAPIIVFGYFAISYILSKLLMSSIVTLVFKQEKLEGDFRFAHVRVRTNSEAIAFYGGENADKMSVETLFQHVLHNKIRLIQWDGWLTCSVLTYFVVALPMLLGWESDHSSAEYVAEASFQSFSQINNFSVQISDIAGFTARIGQLIETMTALPAGDAAYKYNGKVMFSDDGCIEFDRVTTYTPAGNRLVNSLSFKVPPGKRLLIMGCSGVGKTSQLRALAGLWPFFEGVIRVPYYNRKTEFMYLPQTPYLTYGSLRDQIVYPLQSTDVDSASISADRIAAILRIVGLEHLLSRTLQSTSEQTFSILDTPLNWTDLLSPGEQQRLSMARVLFHKPRVVVLDEASSCVEGSMEELFYNSLLALGDNPPTVVSIGHRQTLTHYHDYLLELQTNGRWQLTTLR